MKHEQPDVTMLVSPEMNESMRVLIMSNGRQKKWTVLKHNCNQIYSRYGRMTTPLTHPSTGTIPRCGWCDQKLSDARETLSNLDLVEQ